jgi:DNA-binding MarR family transcriptional regulator
MAHILASMGPTEIQIKPVDNRKPQPSTAGELMVALRGLSHALQEFLTARARVSGLALTELTTLIRAADGNGVHPADAARALGMRSSSMTALADRLEQRRLIRRVPHPTDRRLVYLKATPHGQKHLERALGPLLGQLSECVGALTEGERGTLTQFAAELTALLVERAGTRPADHSQPN